MSPDYATAHSQNRLTADHCPAVMNGYYVSFKPEEREIQKEILQCRVYIQISNECSPEVSYRTEYLSLRNSHGLLSLENYRTMCLSCVGGAWIYNI